MLQTTTPSTHFSPAGSASAVRMLWQTWHRELGGGERLGSGGGGCPRRSCGRGSPSRDQNRPWAAAAGMARVVPAWRLLLLLAVWVRLWRWGPGRDGTCARRGSEFPAPGPPGMCGEIDASGRLGGDVRAEQAGTRWLRGRQRGGLSGRGKEPCAHWAALLLLPGPSCGPDPGLWLPIRPGNEK
ncbi:hypothetical protein J1605_017768 [Eschrichtius robustus]|uniref:Uncharacterized protein n=1 Tax=Eschrichtius robustus TaxID=9764 RepID=A0AB34I081_ESCRO|nr:hypothetical protein J1605_017768 [Eschrichtius robustus]